MRNNGLIIGTLAVILIVLFMIPITGMLVTPEEPEPLNTPIFELNNNSLNTVFGGSDSHYDIESNNINFINEIEGLTLEQLVEGADIADSGTVSFNSVTGVDYYDTLNGVIIAGDDTEKTATNSSGATADMMIIKVPSQLEGATDADTIANIEQALQGEVLSQGLHSSSG